LDKGYATAAIEGKPSYLRPGANWNRNTAKETLNTESPLFGNHRACSRQKDEPEQRKAGATKASRAAAKKRTTEAKNEEEEEKR